MTSRVLLNLRREFFLLSLTLYILGISKVDVIILYLFIEMYILILQNIIYLEFYTKHISIKSNTYQYYLGEDYT